MFCKKCGAEVAAGARFCKGCGAAINQLGALEQARATPQPGNASRRCPQCGADNPVNARFCRRDGYALNGVAEGSTGTLVTPPTAVGAQPATAHLALTTPAPNRNYSRRSLWVALSLFAALVLGAGFYLYWTGIVGNRQASVAEGLTRRLEAMGMGSAQVAISRGWVATVKGEVSGSQKFEELMKLVSGGSGIKAVNTDGLIVRPDKKDVLNRVAAAWAQFGIGARFTATADDKNVVTVSGTADDGSEVDRAIRLVRGVAGVAGVRNEVQMSASWVERQANQTLRNRGLSTVTAAVDAQGNVALSGTVSTEGAVQLAADIVRQAVGRTIAINEIAVVPERPRPSVVAGQVNQVLRSNGLSAVAVSIDESYAARVSGNVESAEARDRALQLVRESPNVSGLVDNLSVRAGRAAGAVAAGVGQGGMTAGVDRSLLSRYAGTWAGTVRFGILAYDFNVSLSSLQAKSIVGQSIYASGRNVLCSGNLILESASDTEIVLSESVAQTRSLVCPAGGIIRLVPQSDGSGKFEWARSSKPDKVAGRGSARRN